MPFPPFGFVEAKNYDRRIYEEQLLLERWRKDMIVSDHIADLKGDRALTDEEWKTMRRKLACDGLDGPGTKALRSVKQKIEVEK